MKKLYSSSILVSACSISVFFCSGSSFSRKFLMNWLIWLALVSVIRSMCIVLSSNFSQSSFIAILFSSKLNGTRDMIPSFIVGKSSSGFEKTVIIIECINLIFFV